MGPTLNGPLCDMWTWVGSGMLECFLRAKACSDHPTHSPRFVSHAIKTAPQSPPSLYCTCRGLQNAIFRFCGKLQLLWTKKSVLHNDPFKAGDSWHTGACWSRNRHWFTVPGKATVKLVESENEAALLCLLRNPLAFPLVSPDTGALCPGWGAAQLSVVTPALGTRLQKRFGNLVSSQRWCLNMWLAKLCYHRLLSFFPSTFHWMVILV